MGKTNPNHVISKANFMETAMTQIDGTSTQMMKNYQNTLVEGEIPEWGTAEYKVWWESQYDQAESHYIEEATPPMYVQEWADGYVGK